MLRLRAKEHFMPLFRPMSKIFRSFLLALVAFVQILLFLNNSDAQDISVTIRIEPQATSVVSISGKNRIRQKTLSFLLSFASMSKLADRLSEVRLFEENGKAVDFKKFVPGEYVANAEFSSWSYKIDLTPSKEEGSLSRVSWLTGGNGILMLDDVLPRFGNNKKTRSAKVSFEEPQTPRDSDWRIITSDKWVKGDSFLVEDIERSVFYVGLDWTVLSMLNPRAGGEPPPIPSSIIDMYFSGDLHVDRNKALDTAWEIYENYRKGMGDTLLPATIAVIKIPGKPAANTWEAETRGRNITILTSDTTFESQTLQQLHEQLRHEIFHLWFPNGINLSGNYDWFYEGFALYQSLKTGVALNRIRFDDYLDTLSRAYDVDRRLASKLSLIDVSKNRWSGDNNTKIYARGMLVAFLCDLALLEKSKGKRSVEDLLRKLYEKHRPPAAEADANTAVLSLLRSNSELVPIIDRNINGADSIEWNDLLKAAGLETASSDQTTKLQVTAKPSGKQKKLLDKLGYNNWRKLASKQ